MSCDSYMPNIDVSGKVMKRGSHPCGPNYRRHCRPAARHSEPVDTSMSRVGFRYVFRQTVASG
jgi:formylglycine-generating enzyme